MSSSSRRRFLSIFQAERLNKRARMANGEMLGGVGRNGREEREERKKEFFFTHSFLLLIIFSHSLVACFYKLTPAAQAIQGNGGFVIRITQI